MLCDCVIFRLSIPISAADGPRTSATWERVKNLVYAAPRSSRSGFAAFRELFRSLTVAVPFLNSCPGAQRGTCRVRLRRHIPPKIDPRRPLYGLLSDELLSFVLLLFRFWLELSLRGFTGVG